jgi:hypothetical protein
VKLLFILTLAALTIQAQTKVILFTDIDPMATMLVAPDTNYIVPANVIPLPDGLGPWYLRMSKEPFTIGEEYPAQLITKDTAFSFYGILPFVLETKNNDEYEVTITRKEAALVSEIYDDNMAAYFGNWTNATNTCCGWQNNTLSYTLSAGSYFTFTFTGEKLEWFAEQKNSHGFAKITIDGVVYPEVSLRSTRAIIPDVLAGIPSATWELEPGQHTIRVEIKDTSGHLVHDFFRGWR